MFSRPRLAAVAATLLAAVALTPATASADLDKYNRIFDQHLPLPDAGTDWVPQGLAYWRAQDALIVSYYDRAAGAPDSEAGKALSQIQIIRRSNGAQLNRLILDINGHVGGLAVTKKYLYVASSDASDGYNLHAYKTSKLLKAPVSPFVGPQIKAAKRINVPIKASYMGTNASQTKLWIGDFDNDKVQRYALKQGGAKLAVDGPRQSTPDNVQGVAIKSGRMFYSTSYGHDQPSTFLAGPVGQTSGLGTLTAPNMSEGIAFARGRVYVVYESSANYYATQSGTLVTRTIDSGPLSSLGY